MQKMSEILGHSIAESHGGKSISAGSKVEIFDCHQFILALLVVSFLNVLVSLHLCRYITKYISKPRSLVIFENVTFLLLRGELRSAFF